MAGAKDKAKKERGMSCDQIVDKMNDLADQYGVNLNKGNGRMSVDTFETLMNINKLDRMPTIDCLVIFCAVVEDVSAIQEMVAPLGALVIGEKDAKLLTWARKFQAAKELRQDIKKLEAEL